MAWEYWTYFHSLSVCGVLLNSKLQTAGSPIGQSLRSQLMKDGAASSYWITGPPPILMGTFRTSRNACITKPINVANMTTTRILAGTAPPTGCTLRGRIRLEYGPCRLYLSRLRGF